MCIILREAKRGPWEGSILWELTLRNLNIPQVGIYKYFYLKVGGVFQLKVFFFSKH